jgi:hypothetical protein
MEAAEVRNLMALYRLTYCAVANVLVRQSQMSSQAAKVLTVCGIALGDASDYEIVTAERAVQLYRFEEAVKYFWTVTRGPPCKRS